MFVVDYIFSLFIKTTINNENFIDLIIILKDFLLFYSLKVHKKCI